MEDLKSEVKLSYTTGGFSVASSLPGVGESFWLSGIFWLLSNCQVQLEAVYYLWNRS